MKRTLDMPENSVFDTKPVFNIELPREIQLYIMKLAFMPPVKLEMPERPTLRQWRTIQDLAYDNNKGMYTRYFKKLAVYQKRRKEIQFHREWILKFNQGWVDFVWNLEF